MLAKTDYYILCICIRGLFKSQQAAKICHFAGCSRACPYAHIPSESQYGRLFSIFFRLF